MRALRALTLCTFVRVVACQANRTVDDFSPLISYSPSSAVTHSDTAGLAIQKLYNGTVAIMNTTDAINQINMTLKFTGTAVWLFLAKPKSPDSSFVTAYDISLDGVPVDQEVSVDNDEDDEYGIVAFANDTLPLGQHSVQMLASDGGTVYFDYAIFTSNDPTPETTIPPVQPPPSSSASASSGKARNTTSPDPSHTSSSGTAVKPKLHVAAIAGATAGVLLLLAACLLWLLVRRRRRQPAKASSTNPQYAAGAGKTSVPYDYSGPGASEATLLRAPTSRSQNSGASASPEAPPLVPQFHPQYRQEAARGYPYENHTQPRYTGPHDYEASLAGPPQPPSNHPHAQSPTPAGQRHQYASPLQVPASVSLRQRQRQTQDEQYEAHHDPDADMARMMAEQRAVEAEYARPAAWVVDEKAGLGVTLEPRTPSPPGAVSPGAHTDAYAYAYPPSPSSGSTGGHGRDPAISSIAAEMRALRAQVARLESVGQTQEEMPPAYT